MRSNDICLRRHRAPDRPGAAGRSHLEAGEWSGRQTGPRARCMAVLCLVAALLLSPLGVSAQEQAGSIEQYLQSLAPAEHEALVRKRERFERLPREEQDRLRALHRELQVAEDGALLRRVMKQYSDWLQTLPSGDRIELLSLPPEERLPEIRRLLEAQQRQRFDELAARALRPSDQGAILDWLDEVIRGRQDELLQTLPPELRRQAAQASPDELRRMVSVALRRRLGSGRAGLDALNVTQQDVDRLAETLSEEARQTLEGARPAERRQLLQRWVAAAIASRAFAWARPEELAEFFRSLPSTEREYLENLPRQRMQSELQRMFFQQRFQQPPGRGPGFDRPPASPLDGPRPGGPRRFLPPRDRENESSPLERERRRPDERQRDGDSGR